MTRVAVVDVGTVTARLAIADVASSRVQRMMRESTIVNLGEGVDKTGMLADGACKRLLACVDAYLAQIRQSGVAAVCCTLTSAARDARNSGDLLDAFAARGLVAQVIPGQVEGSLTFLGVAQDFVGDRLLVADSGGGSTEFALGSLTHEGVLGLDFVRSVDVGCRRVTEKFLSGANPPLASDVAAAHAFARDEFAAVAKRYATHLHDVSRMVVTGGTSTTIVALQKQLVPYDSAQVHLATLSREEVREQEERLAALTVEARAELPGIQAKRAPVILGGVITVGEAMNAFGMDELTVSESDLLFGLSLTVAAAADGDPSPVGWRPQL
ncbi:MAG: phosphatase [Coriobacteriales bacterium]|nr:phosphatase [Coriobacteriales bacterium]